MSALYDLQAKNIHGENIPFSEYKGQYLLVVNLASKCGFTKQYEGLEKLYENLNDFGVQVLGFPCNQFGAQEPGSEQDILQGCVVTYGVKFPMFSKIKVNGEDTHPVYQFLKSKSDFSTDIKWNFEKFLVAPEGEVIKRYGSNVTPEEIMDELKPMLS